MISLISTLFRNLPNSEKRLIFKLGFFAFVISVMEIINIISVAGLVTLISSRKNQDMTYKYMHQFVSLATDKSVYILWMVIFLIIILCLTSIISIIAVMKVNRDSYELGGRISKNIAQYYINSDLIMLGIVSSTSQTNKAITEVNRLSSGVIQPLVHLISKITIIPLIGVMLIFVDPIATMAIFSAYTLIFILISWSTKEKLELNSVEMTTANKSRLKILEESFEGIKVIKSLCKETKIIERYEHFTKMLTRTQASNMTIAMIPRNILELTTYIGISFFIAILVYIEKVEIDKIFALITLYGLSALKLLPALQQIYNYSSTINGNITALKELELDIKNCSISNDNNRMQKFEVSEINSIQLRDIKYFYPTKNTPALNSIDVKFDVGKKYGIIGASGSGKSTLLDLISGLIAQTGGSFLVNGVNFNGCSASWRKNVSYLPQNSFILEGSIKENILFGSSAEEYDRDRLQKVIELSNSTEFISKLTDGVETYIGQRGIQLSGGQRQRIAIARALYSNSKIIILDEGTSALDKESEAIIIRKLFDLCCDKIIILSSHNIKALALCDHVISMKNGQVLEQGSYSSITIHPAINLQ